MGPTLCFDSPSNYHNDTITERVSKQGSQLSSSGSGQALAQALTQALSGFLRLFCDFHSVTHSIKCISLILGSKWLQTITIWLLTMSHWYSRWYSKWDSGWHSGWHSGSLSSSFFVSQALTLFKFFRAWLLSKTTCSNSQWLHVKNNNYFSYICSDARAKMNFEGQSGNKFFMYGPTLKNHSEDISILAIWCQKRWYCLCLIQHYTVKRVLWVSMNH